MTQTLNCCNYSKICSMLFRYLGMFCLCWGLKSQSTIFQSCRDGATTSWVINQYFRGVKCLAQGHNTAAVGLQPPTSRSGVRHSTTEPPLSGDVSRWGPPRPLFPLNKLPCSPVPQNQNLDFLCSLFPKLPLFPFYLIFRLCSLVPLK